MISWSKYGVSIIPVARWTKFRSRFRLHVHSEPCSRLSYIGGLQLGTTWARLTPYVAGQSRKTRHTYLIATKVDDWSVFDTSS